MILRAFLLALGGLLCMTSGLQAQPAAPTDRATPFALPAPDEASPFFLPSQGSTNGLTPITTGGRIATSGYPRNRNSPDTAAAQIRKVFGGLFSSINVGPLRGEPTITELSVEPERFALQDRREVSATYSIFNNTRKITRIEYPTTQRIDILTYDNAGKVIERWSDDRAFIPEEGIVILNPKERIEYQEKVPTRDMKAGESYRIEAKAMTDPSFVVERTITPE